MKLFKKLAAAALAAVLALSMVGCGAGSTGSAIDLKNEVLNYIEEYYYNTSDKAVTHTTAMDTAAADLIEKAATAGAVAGNKDTVKDLLKNNGTGDCIAIFMSYPQLRTEYMQESYIRQMYGAFSWETSDHHIGDDNYDPYDYMAVKIGTPVIGGDDPIEFGAATGTIKGKDYLVLLVKKAAA